MRPPSVSFFFMDEGGEPMNTINNSSVYLATEGQTLYSPQANSVNSQGINTQKQAMVNRSIGPSGAQVAQDIENNLAEIKADTQQLEKMSDLISGTQLQFSVNKELNEVIVTIVDPDTKQVLKELPSKEIQNLKLRIRKVIGNLFDDFA